MDYLEFTKNLLKEETGITEEDINAIASNLVLKAKEEVDRREHQRNIKAKSRGIDLTKTRVVSREVFEWYYNLTPVEYVKEFGFRQRKPQAKQQIYSYKSLSSDNREELLSNYYAPTIKAHPYSVGMQGVNNTQRYDHKFQTRVQYYQNIILPQPCTHYYRNSYQISETQTGLKDTKRYQHNYYFGKENRTYNKFINREHGYYGNLRQNNNGIKRKSKMLHHQIVKRQRYCYYYGNA